MIRHTIEFDAFRISYAGLFVSAAATVTISAPMQANITPSNALITAENQLVINSTEVK